MDEISPLAVFLKKHREAKGFNPREFADAIKAVGGQATTQAVQQWENTTPGQRTTRPNIANRHAIAKVLDCDINEFEAAYRATRAMAVTTEESDLPTETPSNIRIKIGHIPNRFDSGIASAIRAQIPDAVDYLDKIITPFGVRKRYNYLSPKLAVDWLMMRNPNLIMSSSLEGRLWKLLWLSRLDSDTGVSRKYLFILITTVDDPEMITASQRRIDRLRDEARVFGNTLTLCLASSPAEAAELVVAHELGIAAPASTTTAETA